MLIVTIALLLLSPSTRCKYEVAKSYFSKCSAQHAVGEDGEKQPVLIHGS